MQGILGRKEVISPALSAEATEFPEVAIAATRAVTDSLRVEKSSVVPNCA